jgi:formylmethanofuran dehydrogenase subunit E
MILQNMPAELQEVVKFHGHFCPGVALGYRVAILARKILDLGRSEDEELVAIVENDTCAVDAIQYINGTTFGKGNLIFRDYGINAYTFIERISGKQVRIELKTDVYGQRAPERQRIMQKMNEGIALSDAEKGLLKKSREEFLKRILEVPDEELFTVREVNIEVPERARRLPSVQCSKCGLMVMETRARVMNQKFYCIPCWEQEMRRN